MAQGKCTSRAVQHHSSMEPEYGLWRGREHSSVPPASSCRRARVLPPKVRALSGHQKAEEKPRTRGGEVKPGTLSPSRSGRGHRVPFLGGMAPSGTAPASTNRPHRRLL